MVRRKWWRGQCHVGVGVYACVRARDYASYCAQVGGSCGRRRRRRRLGASARAGGTRRQRAVLAGAGGGGLAGLVASAASAVAASARSGGCRLQSWGRGRARARGVSFSFFSFLFPRVRKRKRKGIFADGGVEPGFGARGKAGWRTPRRWAATVGRAGWRPWQESSKYLFFPVFSFPEKNKGSELEFGRKLLVLSCRFLNLGQGGIDAWQALANPADDTAHPPPTH